MASPTSEDPQQTLLKELIALQREHLTWTKFNARNALEDALRSTLKDPRHQAAYELSDGERTQTDIGQTVGLDQSTISQLWSRWRRLGLLQDDARRPKHLISLEDLGWEVPLVTKQRSRTKEKLGADRVAAPEGAAGK